MQITLRALALSLALLVISAGSALADIVVEHPAYAFQTAPQQKNGAVFVGLKNTGDADITITAAQSDIADMLELHTMSMENDIMEMREVAGFTVPANGSLELKPMGDHIMIMGLQTPLMLDATFPLTLVLDNGENLQLDVTVVKPGFTHDQTDSEMPHADHTHN